MMKRPARLILSMICLALPTYVSATDFQITSVRKLGDATWTIAPGLVKFSPNGNLISYIHSSAIVVSDTAGAIIGEFALDGRMMKYEWIDDSQLVVMENENSRAPNPIRRLALLDLPTNTRRVVREYIRNDQSPLQKSMAFEDLFRTASGSVFTRTVSDGSLLKIDEDGDVIKPASRRGLDMQDSDMELFWGRGGLFKRRIGGKDSLWVGPRPVHPQVFLRKPSWDPELKYAIVGGTLLRLADTTFIVIDTMIGAPPEGFAQCGVELPRFNPKYPELVFNLVCYGKEKPTDHELLKERDHVALVDTENWEITLLDTLIGLTECSAPAYSPDGLSISVLSQEQIYVIRRSVK